MASSDSMAYPSFMDKSGIRGITMPTGLWGENRPAEAIGCASKVAGLSIGAATKALEQPSGATRSRHAGAKSRASDGLSPKECPKIANKTAGAGWS